MIYLLVFIFIFTFIVLTRLRIKAARKKLSHLPWVGLEHDTVLGVLRARFQNIRQFRQTCQAAYENYARKGKACVIPTALHDFVLLPSSEVAWLASESEDILNAHEPHLESIQSDYTFAHRQISRQQSHVTVVTRDLTRKLGDFIGIMFDEITTAIDEEWGTDTTQWREVLPFETLMRVVARTSNRVFVGMPLCRSPDYLENGIGYAQEVPKNAIFLRLMPAWLRPLLARAVVSRNKQYTRKFINLLRPLVEFRQANTGKEHQPRTPNDGLQYLIRDASFSGLSIENDPYIISGRLLTLNFAAIYTTSQFITNMIFDLVSPPSSQAVIQELRLEAEAVLQANKGKWTRKGLSQLIKIDSALRESSRLWSILTIGLLRKVLPAKGVTSPISNTYLPHGSIAVVPTYGILSDEDYYPGAKVYKPFRFSDRRVPANNLCKESDDSRKLVLDEEELTYVEKANLSFVSMSKEYHPFGYGRHACPGRFFVANELKLLVAYAILNYDFEMLGERPQNENITSLFPPTKATIRIKRKARR